MFAKLFESLKQAAYFEPHQRVLIALSGGVDSMNLLHFLHFYADDLGLSLGLAHVNYGQRPESAQEEVYLRQLADDLGLPIYVAHFSGAFSEKAGRDFRYAFFKEVMEEHSYTALATAHHADDQAETILMRLIRGSRLRHLVGIKSVQDFGPGQLIRPFLGLTKADLQSVYHFEDSSNSSHDFFRNRVRLDYLPLLEKENPALRRGLQELGKEAELLLTALADLTQGLEVTDWANFSQQSPAVQDYLFQSYLESFPDLQLKRQQYQDCLELLRTKSQLKLPLKRGYFLLKDKKSWQITKISPKTDSPEPVQVVEYETKVSYGQCNLILRRPEAGGGLALYGQGPVIIRGRQPGDRLDFGRFSKKIRRILIDDKIPQEERDRALIGEQDGQVIFLLAGGRTYLRKAPKDGIINGRLYIEKNRNR